MSTEIPGKSITELPTATSVDATDYVPVVRTPQTNPIDSKITVGNFETSILPTYIGFDKIWPIGSTFIGTVSTNPGTLLYGGTWSAVHSGIWISIGDIDLYIWRRVS